MNFYLIYTKIFQTKQPPTVRRGKGSKLKKKTFISKNLKCFLLEIIQPSQFAKVYIGIVQVAVEIFDHARVIRKQVNNFHDLKLILKFSSILISYSY